MTRKSKFASIFVIAFICLLSTLFSVLTFPKPVVADNTNQVNYKKKVVSVVYDNSGSMLAKDGPDRPGYEYRPELANYSLQMLASMLGKDDQLIVCPMNPTDKVVTFEFDLTKENREAEIKDKIINNDILKPSGGTPSERIDTAIDELKKRGLKLAQELDSSSEQNVEYWLIMLTDGAFTDFNTVQKTNNLIENKIKGYASLNTIYVSFGSSAVDLSDPDLSLNKNYPFNAYCAEDPAELVGEMEKVANKILGKYGAQASSFSVNDNKVVIDVDSFDFAMNSITIIAQNCGASITSATLNGKNITPILKNKLSSCGLKDFKDGYLAVFKDDTYISEGKLEIVFDKQVGDVSVLVEPALYIDAYMEYKDGDVWKVADMQYVNSSMKPGDKIRVGYKVYGAADNKEVDTKTIFGDHEEKVTYCGNGYDIGDEIELQIGTNEIYVSVVVKDIAYTMTTSMTCYIEKDPTYYRIEASEPTSIGGNKTQITYKVFVEDKQISYADFSKYEWSIEATRPNGEAFTDYTEELKQDGIIYVTFDGNSKTYGYYSFKAKVTNEVNVSRVSEERKIGVFPSSVNVNCLTQDAFSTTAFLLKDNPKKVEFDLKVEGQDESFENDIITSYSLSINGYDLTSKCEIENGNLTFNISHDTLKSVSTGSYQIKVNVTAIGNKTAEAQYDFTITDSMFVIQNIKKGTNEFDRYDVSNAGAGLYFAVYQDGQALTADQISKALDEEKLVVDIDPSGWITLLPCAVDVTVENIDGLAVVACKVRSDIFSPLDNLLGSFIFDNQKTISVSIGSAHCSGTFLITEVTFVSRVIRWIIILLIILFILHVLLFLAGFIIAKPLPRGVLVKVKINGSDLTENISMSATPLNMKNERLLWHLSRFIPFRELANQRSKTVEEMIFAVNKKNRTVVTTANPRVKRCLIEYTEAGFFGKEGIEIEANLTYYSRGGVARKKLEAKGKAFLKSFVKLEQAPIQRGDKISSSNWYGIHKMDGKKVGELSGFRKFISISKKRKIRK